MAESDNQSWQTTLSTVRERIEYAFNNALYPDITFTVDDSNGDKVSLPANKFILTISSPVFEKMFQGELAEKGPEIHLPDCTENGLREMLRFVYYDVINLTGRNVMEVIYLADKYMLPFLEKRCYNYLANELTPGEVFHVLPQAKKTGNTRAEELCWNVVDLETLPAVTSQPFLDISRDLLKQVLERETLQAEEIDLFKAIDAWASNRIGNGEENQNGEAKREELGDEVVHLIRFPVMKPGEFAKDVLVCNILKHNEVTEVVQIFNWIEPLSKSFNSFKREGQKKLIEKPFFPVEPIESPPLSNGFAFGIPKPPPKSKPAFLPEKLESPLLSNGFTFGIPKPPPKSKPAFCLPENDSQKPFAQRCFSFGTPAKKGS